MAKSSSSGDVTAAAIAKSGLTIYDGLDNHPGLFYDMEILEEHLRRHLLRLKLAYPLRTRAKVVKQAVCEALGYPKPFSFARTRPRFPGQDLDVYVQKSNNLQIWNEEVVPTRRYAIIRLDRNDVVVDVRIVTGQTLAVLDTTGTLTQKYQARRRGGRSGSRCVSEEDTEAFQRTLRPREKIGAGQLLRLSPIARPEPGTVLTILAAYKRLLRLVGMEIQDPGLDQERYRGELLHRKACETLGLGDYADRGQFPDIRCQALEVKLQLSPTIDLGLVSPDSTEPAQEVGEDLRHCDMRYCIVYARRIEEARIQLKEVIVSTGEAFFSEFQRFEGRVRNQKIQLPLPRTFFDQSKRSINHDI
jgi:hypothetical protein